MDLPPTYTIGEKFDFNQIVPDPETPDSIQLKLKAVDKAEKACLYFCEKKFKKK